MSSESDRSRVFAQVVIQGFLDAGLLTDWEIANAGGPSDSYMTALRRAANGGDSIPEPKRPTQRRIEKAAKWEPGSARRLFDGGEPTPLLPDVTPKHSAVLRKLIEEAEDIDEPKRAELLRILDSA